MQCQAQLPEKTPTTSTVGSELRSQVLGAKVDLRASSRSTALHRNECVATTVGDDILRVSRQGLPQRGGGPRGEVKEWTRHAGARLMRRAEEIDWSAGCCLMTLTWRDCPGNVYEHVKLWFRRMLRRYPPLFAIWRIEPHRRGMPHVHLLMGGYSFISQRWAGEGWMAHGGGWVWVTKSPDPGRGAWYLAKYCAKDRPTGAGGAASEAAADRDGEGDAVSLDTSTYQDGDGLRAWGVKRRWGLLGKANVVLKAVTVRKVTVDLLWRLRRVAKMLGQCKKYGTRGFTVRRCPRLVSAFVDGEVILPMVA